MRSSAIALRGCVLIAGFALAGCARPTSSLSGTVSYAGKPLEAGFLTVFPKSGEGASKGTEIVDGRYQIDGLQPGSAQVLVTTPPRYVPDVTAKFGLKAMPQISIPPDAPGNRRVIDLQPGPQTLDITIEKIDTIEKKRS